MTRLLTQPLARTAQGCLMSVGLALTAANAEGQTPPEPVRPPSLSFLLEDRDGDLVPDRLGQRFEVQGHAIMEPRPARTSVDGSRRWYYVTIEDGSAGVRLLTEDETSLSGIHVGTGVVATGVLTHRRGSEELMLEDIRLTSGKVEVEPVDALVRDVLGEGLMHRLVRVEGTLRDFDPDRHVAVLEDRTGSTYVRVPSRLTRDPAFAAKVRDGGAVTVVGIVGQSDLEPPYDNGYRIAPRTSRDLSWISEPPLLKIALAFLFLTLSVGLGSFAYQRRKALRRARELEALTADLKVSERRLAASAAEFQNLFEDDEVARFVLDHERRVQRWNASLEAFLGRPPEEISGRPLHALGLEYAPGEEHESGDSPPDQTEVRATPPDGRTRVGLMTLMRPHGEQATGLRGSIVDVTERKELEARLVRAQKMDALGRLAGGIAHDINNMLSTILGNTELVQEEGPFEASVNGFLAEIEEAALRSARLTRQLLTMARRDVAQPEPLSLHAVARDMAPMLQRVIGRDVELVFLLEDDTPDVLADLSQMEQVLLNLVTNAREALPRGGKISIATARKPDKTSGDDRACLKITDDGIGMDPTTRARMFEPFFSTKSGGTGLGLATVYGIVTECGGTVTCSSEPGLGSTFEILFPITSLECGGTRHGGQAGVCDKLAHTVLLAEDEVGVRMLVRRVLEGAGCTVVEAQNGEEALRCFTAEPSRFDAVLTDLIMPILGGADLAAAVTKLRPDVPIVFMSGYVDHCDARHQVRDSRFFLQKPFRADELIDALSEAVR